MNYNTVNVDGHEDLLNEDDMIACAIPSNEHTAVVLQNGFDFDGIRMCFSVTLAINSQPLQYSSLRQALCYFMRMNTLHYIHLQVGEDFLRDCASMHRWKHIQRMFYERAVHVILPNNNCIGSSNEPHIRCFREFLLRCAEETYPSASRRKHPIKLIVSVADLARPRTRTFH